MLLLCTYSKLFILSLLAQVRSQPRIIGGGDISRLEFPYAMIIISTSNVCSGALIDRNWVLSAAHCFYDKPGPFVISASSSNNTYGTRIVKEIHIHPLYKPNLLAENDLALVKLDAPFELNRNIGILPLRAKGWPQKIQNKVNCTAYGYGRIDTSVKVKLSGLALKGLNVLGRHGDRACPCTNSFEAKLMVCIRPGQGKGLCTGDSGSALVCDGEAVGVAHMILDQRSCYVQIDPPQVDCGSLNTIGVYMYLCPYLNWINGFVSTVPREPLSCNGSIVLSDLSTILFFLFILFFK